MGPPPPGLGCPGIVPCPSVLPDRRHKVRGTLLSSLWLGDFLLGLYQPCVSHTVHSAPSDSAIGLGSRGHFCDEAPSCDWLEVTVTLMSFPSSGLFLLHGMSGRTNTAVMPPGPLCKVCWGPRSCGCVDAPRQRPVGGRQHVGPQANCPAWWPWQAPHWSVLCPGRWPFLYWRVSMRTRDVILDSSLDQNCSTCPLQSIVTEL